MPSKPFKDVFYHNKTSVLDSIFDIGDYRFGLFLLKSRLREKEENEDSLFVSSQSSTIRLGVADGAGGHPRGIDASFEACDEMRVISRDCLLKKIDRANERVIDLKTGSKTTLAFAQIEKDKLSFHTVGDSEIIYWNGTGRILYTSIPHSPSGLKVEAGLTSQEESLTDPDRHIVNSLLGDQFVQINSTSNFEPKKGHTILLGSDGIFDNISHQRLSEIVTKGSFEEAYRQLVEKCQKQDPDTWLKDDDISFILVRKISVS
jgi:serine/threonine protein phosphatase PrpC